MINLRTKKLIGLAVVLGILGAAAGLLAMQFDLREHLESLLAYVRAEGVVFFFTAMALLPLVGVPLSAFVLTAGAFFGPTLGAGAVIGCGAVALAVNAALSYWLAAHGLRPWLERLLVWLGYAIPQPAGRRSWEFTLVLRVVPGVPFCLQSYLLGLARVRFGVYLPVSVLVPTIHLAVAVLAGDALVQGNHTRLLVAGGLFAVVGCGLHLLRKRLKALRPQTQVQQEGRT